MKAKEKLEALITVNMNNIKQLALIAFDDEKIADDLEKKFLMAHLAKNPPRGR